MKHFFTKIVSFLLAVAVVFSTSSFIVDMHYCCDKLIDMAILGKAEACKDMLQKKIPSSKKTNIQEKDCCKTQTFAKQGDVDLNKPNNEIKTQAHISINTLYYNYINPFLGLTKNIIPFKQYRPPLLNKDIQVLHETYLI